MELIELTSELVEQAKEDYRRAVEILRADRFARELDEKQALVGKCFKYVDHLREEPARSWPIYVAVISVDPDTGALTGWNFQTLPSGQIAVTPEVDLHPGFLGEHCHEVARTVFIDAFNELLTDIARWANRIPQ